MWKWGDKVDAPPHPTPPLTIEFLCQFIASVIYIRASGSLAMQGLSHSRGSSDSLSRASGVIESGSWDMAHKDSGAQESLTPRHTNQGRGEHQDEPHPG